MRATIWDTGKLGTKLGYGTIRAVLNRDIDCRGKVVTVNGTPVVWKSSKQVGVALSSTEAEYISISECVKATKWERMVFNEINMLAEGATILHEDNTDAIRWSSGEKRGKYVDIRFHFLIVEVHNGTVQTHYCLTRETIADALTKGVPKAQFEHLREKLQVRECFVPQSH